MGVGHKYMGRSVRRGGAGRREEGTKGGRGSGEALKREGNPSRLRERERDRESLLGAILQ